jgi:hypothetical protein
VLLGGLALRRYSVTVSNEIRDLCELRAGREHGIYAKVTKRLEISAGNAAANDDYRMEVGVV